MTQDPNDPNQPQDPNRPADQPQGPQDPGELYYGQPDYGQQPPPYAPAYGPPPYGPPGWSPQAPYGVHPVTGVPYSDKSKIIAGVLQLVIPLGIGRMYMGDVRTGVIQLVVTIVTCGIGALWPFIDGIMILVGDPKDEFGRPLRS